MQQRKIKRMKSWPDLTHYAGFDWAKDHHAVLILNQQGAIVADFEFEHSLEGWKSFVSDPEVPAILQEAGHLGRPQVAELGGTYDA